MDAIEERQCYEKRRSRQTISVPFVWEEEPGKPKKDWKLESLAIVPLQPPPKLVVCIPFTWEEKPGKPWDFSSDYLSESPTSHQQFCVNSSSSSHFSIATSHHEKVSNEYFDSDNDEYCFTQSPVEVVNQPIESDTSNLEQIANQEDECLDNQLQLVPYKSEANSSFVGENDDCFQTSVIEFLFPLLFPRPGNLVGKVTHQDGEAFPRDEDESNKCRQIGKRAPTLGELMLMSRRLSYATKVVPLTKKTHFLMRALIWLFGEDF